MNGWSLCLQTIITSYVMNAYIELKQVQDLANAGYKINYQKLKYYNSQSPEEFFISPLLIPGYNIILIIMLAINYHEQFNFFVEDLKELDLLEEMNEIELKEYQKNPTLINANLLRYKMKKRLKKANLLTISLKGELSDVYFEYTNNHQDIVILQVNGSLSLLSLADQKEVVKDILNSYHENDYKDNYSNKDNNLKEYDEVLAETKSKEITNNNQNITKEELEQLKFELLEQQEIKENNNPKKLTKKITLAHFIGKVILIIFIYHFSNTI